LIFGLWDKTKSKLFPIEVNKTCEGAVTSVHSTGMLDLPGIRKGSPSCMSELSELSNFVTHTYSLYYNITFKEFPGADNVG
jgi:hypothetical protein